MTTRPDIRAALERMRKQREALEADMAILEMADSVLAKYESPVVSSSAANQFVPDAELIARASTLTAFAKPAAVAEAARKAMAEGAVWRQLPQLRGEIEETGIKIAGVDPVNNLSTILSRNKEKLGFVADKRRGWALASRVGGHDGLSSGAELGQAAQKG